MGQRDLAAGQAAKQGRRRAAAVGKPGQPGEWVVHAEQLLGQRGQAWVDAAGAVVEQFGEPVGERAAGAAAAAVQLAGVPVVLAEKSTDIADQG